MSNKQNSVEWLQWALEHTILTHEQIMQTIGLFEQAKAMHREEHGQTWDKSMENFEARGRNEMRAWVDFDEYYEQTYESNS